MTDDMITSLIQQKEAKKRYDRGDTLQFSTGIDERMTYGYGELDKWGFWEFPLRYNYLRPEHKMLVDQADANHLQK